MEENRQELITDLAQGALAFKVPGVVIAVLVPGSDVVQVAVGRSSLTGEDPMQVEHRFAIGSISKTLTAVVTHQLAQEGVLDLRAPPAEYVDAATLDGIPNATTAPLRTLLEHSSGIPTWEFDADWIRRGRGDQFDPERPFANTDTLAFVRRKAPATNAPGTSYAYSNTNHTILGLVIEAVTGNTFAAEVRRRVLEPLRLSSFALESFEPIPAGAMATPHHLATPFFRSTAGVSRHFVDRGDDLIDTSAADLSPEWAAGGYVAAMADLARYGQALASDFFGDQVGAAMRGYREIDGTPGTTLFVAQPGEAYSLLQLELRRRFPEYAVVVMNSANGTAGYLPPADLYDRDIYQVWQTPFARGGHEALLAECAERISLMI